MNHLATKLAISDAWHDFNKYSCDPTSFTTGVAIFNKSVREEYPAGTPRPSENDVLGSVSESDIRSIIDQNPETVGQMTTRSNVKFISKVIALNTPDGNGRPRPGVEIATSANFPVSFGIIVDFNQHGILGRFVSGPAANKTCYYLYTSETENDPAGKTSQKDSVFTPKEGGIQLRYCEQVGGDPIVYSGDIDFNPGNHNYKLDFYSKYTLTLSPIQRIKIFGSGKKTTVNLTVSNNANTLVHQIADAKKANSIKSIVAEFMKKIIGGPWNPSREFNANAGWIQKRSGDWLQVLACLDVHNRKFEPPLPPGTPIFFVTHDRVALSYALLMGVNTIFIKPEHRIVVFTRADLATQDLTTIYAAQTESIKNGDGTGVYRWLKLFQTMRDEELKIHKDRMNSGEKVLDIVKEMLHYTHSYLEIQDVSSLLSALSRFKGPEYPDDDLIETEDSKVVAAYVSAVSIMKVHIGPRFRLTFRSNFESKDVFQSLKKSLEERNVITRLVKLATGKVDRYSFLGYISKLPDEETKRAFIGKLGSVADTNELENDLIRNAIIIVNTRALFEGSSDTSISAVVESHSYNDNPNDGSRNHEPDQADEKPEAGGSRGGWKEGTRYAIQGGATVVFPIKQTTQVLVVAHILKPPPVSLLNLFGLLVPRFEDIAMADNLVTETGEDPRQLQFGGAKTDEHLFPIYAMLDAFTPNICERLEGSMDMEHYNRYYAFLEALKRRSEAITDPSQKDLIAMALREVLFISAQSEAGRASILSCIGETPENYAVFASMTTTFSNYMCGELPSYTPEYQKGVDAVLQDQTVLDVIGGAWKDSASFRKDMTVSELDSAVEKLKLELVSVLTRADTPVPGAPPKDPVVLGQVQEAPLKTPLVRSNSMGDPTPFSFAGRRRTRRLTNDFLQSVRHQSIKMSSKRHSVSGKPFKR